ncbi:MAG TPA: M15 family peptidase [Planctomycetes bacterium]|nr:M15 family peptidase [Planctomycetota bacterium]
MGFDDGVTGKGFEALLDMPDIEDQFAMTYPTGELMAPPAKNFDPGRFRNDSFFTKMYGDCSKGEVEPNLVTVNWLPKKGGGQVRVTRINGVDKKIKAISDELDALPDRFTPYLVSPGGTYVCRVIAGTKRRSAHAYGTAIDINVPHSDYWRWSKPKADGTIPYRNRIPYEIVRIFEKHGFIWGGKWYHYDTMHFEYRPELLPGKQTPQALSQP